jgi:ankyrin repeat protein
MWYACMADSLTTVYWECVYGCIIPQNGWTPLMQACQDGEVELVRFLVGVKDVNIDHQSKV